ncbi:MAG: DNA-binding protein [Hyphomicrobiaceae bacterium]|nr:MAG: DNA-binding protein [Hyphomicrobiaceae bacterium]
MQLLELTEAAERLSITVSSLRKLIAAKRIVAVDVGTGTHHKWKLSEQAIADFQATRTNQNIGVTRTRRTKAAPARKSSQLAKRETL